MLRAVGPSVCKYYRCSGRKRNESLVVGSSRVVPLGRREKTMKFNVLSLDASLQTGMSRSLKLPNASCGTCLSVGNADTRAWAF